MDKISDKFLLLDNNLLKGIFLLILAIAGNYIAELFGCQTRYLLNNNIFVKHFLTLVLIYFTLGFTDNSHFNPLNHLKLTLLIWTTLLFFTKMSINFTVFSFILICIIYVMNDYINYLEKNSDKNKNQLVKIKQTKQFFEILFYLSIIIGFSIYAIKQYNEHNKDFSVIKLIFGTLDCDSELL